MVALADAVGLAVAEEDRVMDGDAVAEGRVRDGEKLGGLAEGEPVRLKVSVRVGRDSVPEQEGVEKVWEPAVTDVVGDEVRVGVGLVQERDPTVRDGERERGDRV